MVYASAMLGMGPASEQHVHEFHSHSDGSMVNVSKPTGFTLIELMVVIVIVGVLSAFAIPNFLRYRAQAMQAEARSNLGTIFVGEVSFFTEQKEFGNFSEIGFAITDGGTNRYTYRSGLGYASGLGPNGGNLCGSSSSCDTIQTESPAPGLINFTGLAGMAITSTSGFTATAAANLDGDATHDGWYVNDAKQGLIVAQPNDVTS
jgi:prepilin-type N-terminal cleavage/methylation domain-containing protein